jgi:WD40 repeat protein
LLGTQVWQLFEGHDQPRPIHSLAWAPDNRHIACGCEDGTILVQQRGVPLVTVSPPPNGGSVYSIAFSPTGGLLASGCSGNWINIWKVDSEDNQLGLTYLRGLGETRNCLIINLQFSPFIPLQLASLSDDGQIDLWAISEAGDNYNRRNLIPEAGDRAQQIYQQNFSYLDFFSRKNTLHLLLSPSHNESIEIWDLRRQSHASPARALHTPIVLPLPIVPDFRSALASSDDGEHILEVTPGEGKGIRRWHMETGTYTRIVDDLGSNCDASTLTAFSPNRRQIVIAMHDHSVKKGGSRTLRIWFLNHWSTRSS